jgi:hypothetical protein
VGAGNPVIAVDLAFCSRARQNKFGVWLRDGHALRHLEYSCHYDLPTSRCPGCSAGWACWPDDPLAVGCSARVACQAWDDLRLVGLKLIFVIVIRAVSLLGLSWREEWWKDAEILMMRHQLAVAQRQRPRAHSRLTWPDRAWLALLAGTVPGEHLAAMRLIVTPGTIVR